jgi:hypothetical protein
MPKHKFESKYYAEDKDIFDLLKSSPIPTPRLFKIARDRGIYMSEDESRDAIISYLAELPFSWPQLSALMAEMESDDKEDKLSFLQLEEQASSDAFYTAMTEIQKERTSRDETFRPTATKDGKIDLKVSYTEFTPSVTRLKQKRQRELKIEAEVKDGKLQIRYHSNKKSAEILTAIFAKFPQTVEKPLKKTLITLAGIKNAEQRTSFFESLWNKMDGLSFRDVKDVRVDRIASVSASEDEEEKENEEVDPENEALEGNEGAEKKPKRRPKKEKEFKSIVRRMALTGEGLHKSPQYLALVKEGFFISKAVWVCREAQGAERDILLSAEFQNAEEAIGFTYDVRWMWERDENGDLKTEKSLLTGEDRKRYIELLEQTAVTTISRLNTAIEEATPAPDSGDQAEVK